MSDASPMAAIAPVRAQVDAHLSTLVHDVDGLMGVVVASLDGFALAQVGREEETVSRLAAMTSSMLALAEALGRELAIGSLGALILEASHGKVLMLTIPVQPPQLLMAACDQTSAMGQVLWHAKQCVRRLAATLPSDAAH
ncbi:roadblock/LC7 domain-containing protein [Stenotrophomonas sp. BIGb0135]|uniref:roadblock/LC7 domain-containing protein n=1 Tax=Stenotrophomonas sp. BIGb0135 TaxID=2940620 RepID=UPI0021683DCA|nr:roadblock/LC7 domain-containing protein [Stenotrophomonas sp. BIGb0135]MCS4233121.1 putative regulator of Ras-like GTPase activity (Roadblock/LC7/MglB family) [Stenotrophomonas sp. BIGb0135]